MTTATEAQQPGPVLYNHWGCQGCDGSRPLTLGDRELLAGASAGFLRQSDDGGRTWYCTACLADLPDGVDALAHVCGQPAPEPEPAAPPAVTAYRLDPTPRPRKPARKPEDRFVSGYLRAWVADRDAALKAAAEYGCDPDWCTAYRWDGHHASTCRLARIACIRAGLPDTLAEMGYVDPIILDD